MFRRGGEEKIIQWVGRKSCQCQILWGVPCIEEAKVRKTILPYGKVWIHTAVKDRQVGIRIRKEEQKKVVWKKDSSQEKKK